MLLLLPVAAASAPAAAGWLVGYLSSLLAGWLACTFWNTFLETYRIDNSSSLWYNYVYKPEKCNLLELLPESPSHRESTDFWFETKA